MPGRIIENNDNLVISSGMLGQVVKILLEYALVYVRNDQRKKVTRLRCDTPDDIRADMIAGVPNGLFFSGNYPLSSWFWVTFKASFIEKIDTICGAFIRYSQLLKKELSLLGILLSWHLSWHSKAHIIIV